MALGPLTTSFSLDKPNQQRGRTDFCSSNVSITKTQEVSSSCSVSIVKGVCWHNTSLFSRWGCFSSAKWTSSVNARLQSRPSPTRSRGFDGKIEEWTGIPDVKQAIWHHAVGQSEDQTYTWWDTRHSKEEICGEPQLGVGGHIIVCW